MSSTPQFGTSLGLGLLSIGRTWGVGQVAPPSEQDAIDLIHAAHDFGIRFFDTAPAYGTSERLFGMALIAREGLAADITIATKFGEIWRAETQDTAVSHRFDDLARSLDTSMGHLGRIDVLQLHKASLETVVSPDVVRAFDRARSLGIRQFGASVSDLATAELAVASGLYGWLQFPLNSLNRSFVPLIEKLHAAGMRAIINRPFAMGALAGAGDPAHASREAFRFVLDQGVAGQILTGTSSRKHLADNVAAFKQVGGTLAA